MSSENVQNRLIKLYVRADPFTTGMVPAPPPAKLSMTNLKKAVHYAKSKGSYPSLKYSIWRHMACNKMLLTEEVAWLHFESALLSSPTPTGVDRHDMESKLARLHGVERDAFVGHLEVDCLRFVLLLFLQQYFKVDLRSSLFSGDEWPAAHKYLNSIGQMEAICQEIVEDQRHLMFVMSKLDEILDLLVEAESGSVRDSNEKELTYHAVEALSYLLAGTVDGDCVEQPLIEIALMPDLHSTVGYMPSQRLFSYRQFQSWLRRNVSINPFGSHACLAHGTRLSWSASRGLTEDVAGLGAGEPAVAALSRNRARICSNTEHAPAECRVTVLCQLTKQTIGRSSSELHGSNVIIHRCNFSHLYLLAPMRSVKIQRCKKSLIVLGAVECTLHVEACEGVTIVAAARRITVRRSSACTFHLLTPCRPLVLHENEKLVLAPFHTFYPRLEQHLSECHISAKHNLWNQPLHVAHDGAAVLMDPDDFFPFKVPYRMDGPTKAIPGGLPPDYRQAVVRRKRAIEEWKKFIRSSPLTAEQRRRVHTLVEHKFQDWLVSTGLKRQLDQLVTSSICSPRML